VGEDCLDFWRRCVHDAFDRDAVATRPVLSITLYNRTHLSVRRTRTGTYRAKGNIMTSLKVSMRAPLTTEVCPKSYAQKLVTG
jgi:hypothetical protein